MSLRKQGYPHPSEFLSANSAELLKHECFHSLFLGLATRLAEEGDLPKESRRYPDIYERNIFDGDTLRYAILRTPPYPIVVAAFGDAAYDDIREFAALIHEDQPSLPGINGERVLAMALSDAWLQVTGEEMHVHHEQRLHELDTVIHPSGSGGSMRVAVHDDLPLVLDWSKAFCLESGVLNPDATVAQTVHRVRTGEIFLWEKDGAVKSMAAKTRPTVHSISVAMVYTPDAERGHGYASNLVAALSQHLLDDCGYRFCTLFTDLANPVSNSIYQKIGYRPVADFVSMVKS